MKTVLCVLVLCVSSVCVWCAETKTEFDLAMIHSFDTKTGKKQIHIVLKGKGLYSAQLLAHPKEDVPPDTVRIVSMNDDYMDIRLKTDDKTSEIRLSGMRFSLQRKKESIFGDKNNHQWEVVKGTSPLATAQTIDSIGSIWWQRDSEGKGAWFLQEVQGSKHVRTWKRMQPK
ncbi:hypothetical protein A3D11_01200 [Candidatus Peribacteria bacterium RIFCSPHIGHO2_02_FULL_49_16]|nr:MAG: hypothetical protein A2880_02325 [Candidatus Peribacteria bacterium RIFCSPHIGHO2_01_FULL_49_38]OGJ59566.1 MAG: hypothetical protein A3D11_01200 [Candidatus Peribacteria bacterium RIFCSPHIGHO2_02_FULL_49_16]